MLALGACGEAPSAFAERPLVGARSGHYKETEATKLARNFTVHGVDVSKYQGNVNWDAVHEGGVKFAYIKATEGGDRIDPNFVRNWQGAKAAGLPRGAYHFVYWCRPWQDNMAWFEKNVPPERDALPPVLDVEATPDSPDLPASSRTRGHPARHPRHARGDAALLRQEADHLHHGRFLPVDHRRRA